MIIEIITQKLELKIYGFSGIAANKDYLGMAFKLSGMMWQTVKENGIINKGKNIWIYEPNEKVFAGVELENNASNVYDLEEKNISLIKYAYFKHIGPYNLIKQVGTNMRNELRTKGFETTLPYIEIYGHWSNDDSKCETELLMSLL
ncbi:MAG: GyrI-like domain-containing protein [Saprospiraceae bacterium]